MLALFDKVLFGLHNLNNFLFSAVLFGFVFQFIKNLFGKFARN